MKKTDVGRHREVGVYLDGVGVNMIKTDEMKSSKKSSKNVFEGTV